ncbi:Uncharacterised protein [Nocardia asteroides]|nr:hypothetical protein SAMN05444423_10819 [Nocardia asteroides]VEG36453.1 Uncharacterised protein [Nocardia asteroides]
MGHRSETCKRLSTVTGQTDDTITVREEYGDLLHDRDIAYMTVMTTMDNRHRKGWLERERLGLVGEHRVGAQVQAAEQLGVDRDDDGGSRHQQSTDFHRQCDAPA